MSAPKKVDAPVPLSQVIVSFAKVKNITDTTKAGKLLRSQVRSNFAHLQSTFNWPPEEKANRDGNRYPPMPATLAAHIAEHGKVPTAPKAGETESK